MAGPIYTDDPPPPRRPRRKKPKGQVVRPLTAESRDVKLMRLPYKEVVTLSQAAAIMGMQRNSLQVNYLYTRTYLLPDYIELIYDVGRIVGIKRIGP